MDTSVNIVMNREKALEIELKELPDGTSPEEITNDLLEGWLTDRVVKSLELVGFDEATVTVSLI
ncbi:hypothetical protein [Xenorhabdus sp. KJ12.1]|uniref:hypothetical protein n=1 Tax=Xenorhabdus sp. KJ12.1 TaxID=1851571 RepID=UPI000C03A5ED|nr:hypothetical protein [Xenorhabdus sp. KJ12.1]PHM72327.1 hypothetical protein Xekj_00605 [Xenorhabdus sp. KJ12.1]